MATRRLDARSIWREPEPAGYTYLRLPCHPRPETRELFWKQLEARPAALMCGSFGCITTGLGLANVVPTWRRSSGNPSLAAGCFDERFGHVPAQARRRRRINPAAIPATRRTVDGSGTAVSWIESVLVGGAPELSHTGIHSPSENSPRV